MPRTLATMSRLRVPSVSVVIGEGGSGGALAIGVADRILMLENATYSVITPEGAAAILWKDKDRVPDAAAALNLTAPHLLELGLIDRIIPEPLGGAHKDFETTAAALKAELVAQLDELAALSADEVVASRYDRYRNIGRFREAGEDSASSPSSEDIGPSPE